MKKCIALLLLIAASSFCFAQNAYKHQQDVVYLKNGGIVRGYITEQIPNQSLKIETGNGSTLIFNFNEIDKITKEEKLSISRLKKNQVDSKTGFRLAAQIGLGLPGLGAISLMEQYHYNRHFSTGIGIGIELNAENGETPFFVDNRFYISKRKITPYFYNKMGIAVVRTDFYFGIGAGLRINISPKRSFIIDAGAQATENVSNFALHFGYLF